MADETTEKSEADETTDNQVEATADAADQETADKQSSVESEIDEGGDQDAAEGSKDDDQNDAADQDATESKSENDARPGDSDKDADKPGDDADKDAEKDKDEADEYGGVSMEQVEAILSRNAGDSDKADLNLTPQMQRMFDRELENTKRVEETIKGAKSNPAWFVPLFVALLIIGLIWVVAFYFTGKYPIPQIGQWNLLVGFGIMLVGFLMTMGWH